MLSQRQLNRTLLRRQLLLSRQTMPPYAAIRRLVAMQSQHPNGPYVGLWSRLDGFERSDLTELLISRKVVRSTMLRRTQHIASAEDFLWLRPSVAPVISVALNHPFYAAHLAGLDLDVLAAAGRSLLGEQVLSRRALGKQLAGLFPDRHGGRLADSVELIEALVHPVPGSAWGNWGHPNEIHVALASSWIGRPLGEARLDELVLRYLAAFGPASIMDVQSWAGITRMRAVVERLRLRTYRSESGTELFDLPDAELADPDRPAPVRFLPSFENALLSHKDRTRVISEEDRKRSAWKMSGGVPMFLVDGFVQGTWAIKGSVLTVESYRQLSKPDADAVLAEAHALLDFVTDEPGPGDVRLTQAE